MVTWDDWLALRDFITQCFSDEEVVALCYEKFWEVYDNFSDGTPKSQKVRALIDYCRHRGYFDYLHQVLAEKRPSAYANAFTFVRNETLSEDLFADIADETNQDNQEWDNFFANISAEAQTYEQTGASQSYLAAAGWSDANYAADTNTGSTVERWGTSVRNLFNDLQERVDNFSMQDPASLNMVLGALATVAAFVIVAILFSIFSNPPSTIEVAPTIPVLVAGTSQQLPVEYREPVVVLTQDTPPRRLSITLQDCIYAGCTLLFASDSAVRTAHLFPLDCVIVEPFMVVVTNGSMVNYQVTVTLLTEEFDKSTCIIQRTPTP